MSVAPSDLVFFAGGECLSRYGVLVKRTSPAEDVPETFVRAGAGLYVAKSGVIRLAAANVPRVSYGGQAFDTPALLLEAARTNLALQSENFGTTWVADGTPTRVAGAQGSSGISLDLIGDDAAGALEGFYQVVTFTGDAVKALSFAIAQGTSASSAFRIRDTTAGVNRVFGVVTWSGGLPVVTMTTGAAFPYQTLRGAFRVLAGSTSITASHTHELEFFPATDAALSIGATGDVYLGGVQVEDALFPSSYQKTTTVGVARAAETFSVPFLVPPTALTVYVHADWNVAVNAGTNYVAFVIGTNGATYLLGRLEGGDLAASTQHGVAGTSMTVATANAPTYGQRAESRHVLNADGSVLAGLSVAGAAEVVSATSGALALASAWSNALINLGTDGGQPGFLGIRAVKIALGIYSMQEMREAF